MNQEQNNLNQNNFNTQETNEIPNNQPLNNMNQNVNQTTFNTQPEITVNQINVQQPTTSQPTNYFENVNNNNNLNFKQPKKNNMGLIIIIISTIIIIGIIITVLLLNKKSNPIDLITNGNNALITENDINKYNIEKRTIWINEPLGITYNIPKINIDSNGGIFYNGAHAFTYMHGASFHYYTSDFEHYIFVDKSVENNNNLETLANDIIGEKISDKYNSVYKFGFKYLQNFKNVKTEKVKINNINTIYFESETILTNDNKQFQIIGYNFEYNNQKMSVYGTLPTDDSFNKDLIKKYMQYMINSIKKYKGESLQALNGNISEFYDGELTNKYSDQANTKFSLRAIGPHIRNGILRQGVTIPTEINPSYLNWDGSLDGILEATKNQKLRESGFPYYYTNGFEWVYYEKIDNTWTNVVSSEILKEDYITINNIKMKHYVLKTRRGEKSGKIISIYTFILDNIPYIYAYGLNDSLFDGSSSYNKSATGKYIVDMTEEELNVIIDQTEVVAKSAILSLEILDNNN